MKRDLKHDLMTDLKSIVTEHAIERALKAEALVRELLEVMMSVAYQECGYEENGITKFDSMAIGARMELLLTLIEHGRLEEINSFGRRVIAKLPGAKEVLDNERD